MGRAGQILHFLRQLLLKITYGLKKNPWVCFWLKKLKNDIEIALQPTGTELQPNRIKITLRYISVKKKDVAL